MAENQHDPKIVSNALVLRVPRPNLQIIILALIAVITIFQTFQLIRISSKTGQIKAVSPVSTTTNGSGSGSNTDVPQSMVGGC